MSRNVFLTLAVVVGILSCAYFYAKDALHQEPLNKELLPVCENPNGQLATFYKPERLVIDLVAYDEKLPSSLSPFFKRDALVKFIEDTAQKNFAACLTRGRSGVVLFDGRSGKRAGKDLVKDENLILSLSVWYNSDAESAIKGTIRCKFFRSGLPPHVTYLSYIRSGSKFDMIKKEGLSPNDAEQTIEKAAILFLDECLRPGGEGKLPPTLGQIGFMPQ